MSLKTTKTIRLDGGISSSTHEIIANVKLTDGYLNIVTKQGEQIVDDSPLVNVKGKIIKDIIWANESDFGWVYGFNCAVMFDDNSVFIYTRSWKGGSSYIYSKMFSIDEKYNLTEEVTNYREVGIKNNPTILNFDNCSGTFKEKKVRTGEITFQGVAYYTNCHGYWVIGYFTTKDKELFYVNLIDPSSNEVRHYFSKD